MKRDRISASQASVGAGTRAQPASAETTPSRGTRPPPRPPRRRLLPRRTARADHVGPNAARRRGSTLRRLLAICDWTAAVAGIAAATALTAESDSATFYWAVLFSPAWILVVKLHGLYDNDHRRIRHSTIDEAPALVSATVLAVLVLDGLLALSPAGALEVSSATITDSVALAGSLILRAGVRTAWGELTDVTPGVLVGTGAPATKVARRLETNPEARIHLVGFLGSDDDPAGANGLPRLGAVSDLKAIAAEHGIERVVVADHAMSNRVAESLIGEGKEAGLSLTFLPRHYALLGPGVELNRIADLPVLDFRFSDPPRSTMLLKRTMDLIGSGVPLILLSPLFLGISLLIKLDSRGPVFFRQTRAGKDGKPFTMLKFRTMVDDAEERLGDLVDLKRLDQPAFKIPDDPRVTRVGRVLRRLSIDELPQLLNVLRGEMSLVGPRPEEEAVVALYNERQRARLAVKPGLTGPMQVNGRGNLSFEERLALERDYLDNISVTSDLAILMRTPRAIIRGDGAY